MEPARRMPVRGRYYIGSPAFCSLNHTRPPLPPQSLLSESTYLDFLPDTLYTPSCFHTGGVPSWLAPL